jgi:hypothetical protein
MLNYCYLSEWLLWSIKESFELCLVVLGKFLSASSPVFLPYPLGGLVSLASGCLLCTEVENFPFSS